jgi:DNA modification methylase
MSEWHPGIPEEYRNAIVTGDARELARRIPDESVDLVFTDPVYDRIEDYRWLAETAARVLKPDSACLVFTGPEWDTRCAVALGEGGLRERWRFVYYLPGSSQRATCGFNHYVPLLWFEKGHSKQRGTRADVFLAQAYLLRTANHRWNKDPRYVKQHIEAFTTEGAVIYDPFTGGGTVPAVCKMLGRNWIASEIDPDTAERARQRVAETQPPLFVLSEEQAVMEALA